MEINQAVLIFRRNLRLCMMHIGINSCKADTDICIRESHKDDVTLVWGYLPFYVDDAFVISNRGEDFIRK